MRRTYYLGAAVSVAIMLGFAVGGGLRTSGQTTNPRPVIQWEYKSISVGNDESLPVSLNSLGATGWEMVTAYTKGRDGMGGVQYIFKRPK